jgi:chromosome segregation ATPase
MGIADDLKIEAAVQAAMASSAEARALALVGIAVDPAGTKARLDQLIAATKQHDEALSAAQAGQAAAEAKQADADARAAEVDRRVSDTQAWIERSTRDLQAREAVAREAEEVTAKRQRDLANREASLNERLGEHRALMKRLRSHLDEAGE